MLGVVISIAGALWWWFAARRRPGAAVIPLAAPLLGVAHLAPMTPLLAGFSLPVFEAAAAGLVGGLLSVLASAASFVPAPYDSVDPRVFVDVGRAPLVAASVRAAFLNPATYVALVGWLAAAAVMSWFSARATRLSAMIGAVLASLVFVGAYVLADLVSVALGNGSVWVTTGLTVSVVASLTMVVLVAALGAPVRPEEDTEPE